MAEARAAGSILSATPSSSTQTSANSPNPKTPPQISPIPQISLTESINDVSLFKPISLVDCREHMKAVFIAKFIVSTYKNKLCIT
jgi:hypothetical protein